jgi:hypothetical protein
LSQYPALRKINLNHAAAGSIGTPNLSTFKSKVSHWSFTRSFFDQEAILRAGHAGGKLELDAHFALEWL